MTDEVLAQALSLVDRGKYYRAQAELLRARVPLQPTAETRQELIAMAAHYESLADYVDALLSAEPKPV